MKEVLEVNCLSNFLKDFLLQESACFGRFSSVYFCMPLKGEEVKEGGREGEREGGREG